MRHTYQAGKTVTGLLLAAALASGVQAQGLGEITLDSGLYQPLRAHIELTDVAKLDAAQIKAGLASESEFKVAGVERPALLSQLKFEVQIDKAGSGRILVSSSESISEPYLDFLLGVSWPSGRTLREYTLLFDLPDSKAQNAAAVSSSRAGGATSFNSALAQYEVKRGDSLYQIAEQTRPAADVGVQQMMIAIQRANEDAFVNNNVNRILVGKVLRIPRLDEIRIIDQEAAVAQVNQQNAALRSETLAVNDAVTGGSTAVRDELTLLSGNQQGSTTAGSGDLDATIKSLESELMLSEEGLDRARLENLELTNRLSAIQEQIEILQNIIAIEDERIAQLQAQLSKQSADTAAALASADSQGEESAAPAEGLVALLSNSVVVLGAGLAAVMGVALMLFIRRRNALASIDQAESVSLDELADKAEAASERPGIGEMVQAFLARFRKPEPEEDSFEEEISLAPEVVTIADTPAVVAAEAAPKKEEPGTNQLLDEMGIGSEFMNLQNALEEVEAEAPSVNPSAEGVSESDTGDENDLLAQALNEAELTEAAVEAEAEPAADIVTAPESFAFTTDPGVTEVASAVAEPTAPEPEVFEFTLPNLDEAEADTATAHDSDDEKPEAIAFDSSAFSLDNQAEGTSKTDDDALEVLSFDENSVVADSDVDDDSSYSPGDSHDTHDARLDLAVAYEAMGDLEGAIEILDEVIASGKVAQAAEAQRLKAKWQNS